MLDMSGHSKIICKILIDQDEYLKLKDFEHQIHELNEKRRKQLEIVPSTAASSDSNSSSKPNLPQVGTGFSQNFDNDMQTKLIQNITEAVKDSLINQFRLDQVHSLLTSKHNTLNIKQTGTGVEDNQRPLTEPTLNNTTPLPAADIITEKSKFQDKFDENHLIQLVPVEYQQSATHLLDEIRNYPLDIMFNSNGELFIDSVSIPNANIYKIFPALFIKTSKYKIPGLSELTTKLASLNLTHLFQRGIVKPLKRPKNYPFPLPKHQKQINEANYKHWWFIGN